MDSIWAGGWIFTSPWFLVPGTVFWGSFLNQVADRTPPGKMSDLPWPPISGSSTATGPPTLWRPSRSFCFSCGIRLAPLDLIPVLSHLWLRGACRNCGGNIGRRTLVVELLTPLLLLGWWRAAHYLEDTALEESGLALHGALYGGFAVLSWSIVAGVLAWERRRFPRGFLGLGVLLAMLLAAGGLKGVLVWGL